jgi:hypothetical protein
MLMVALTDLMFDWLGTQGYTGAMADRRHAYFKANDYATWRDVYNANGGTGQLNDWLLTFFTEPEPEPSFED